MKRTNCLKLTLVSSIHSFIHLFIHSSSVYMALSLLLHERFDFVQLLQKRVSKDKPYFWLALSVRFYDLNELFMRGCSFPISSISCLHEPYRQNMRIMRFRLCPDGYGPPRLAKINKSSKDRTWSAVPDALLGVISWRSRVRAGQRPQRADVFKDTGVNFHTSWEGIYEA